MAINLNLLPLFAALPIAGGRILTLGKQKPLFTSEQLAKSIGVHKPPDGFDQSHVFHALGFEHCESLDISDHEGVDHIFDLNDSETPPDLISRFDLVFTGGTLEHVFHVSQALRHAASFVRRDGLLVHLGPANGWINHGFYQLCPGLLLDYLKVNGWKLEMSALIDATDKDHWHVMPATHTVRHRAWRQQHFCVARRTARATTQRTPIQKRYSTRPGAYGTEIPTFQPFDIRQGVIFEP